jgi:hypothetical protein
MPCARTVRRALLTAACASLLAPAAAPAATVSVQGTALVVAAGAGERNRLTVAPSGASLRIADRVRVRAGAGCEQRGSAALCPAAGLVELIADLGDRSDRITVAATVRLRARVSGGPGDDVLIGGGGPDLLIGDAGRDRLEGRGGDDVLDGRGGADTLVGGHGDDAVGGGDGDDVLLALRVPDGADVLAGGAGTDRVDYGPRRSGVVADPDGRADDGARAGGALSATGIVPAIALLTSGERDMVMPDVESLRGGHGDDVLAAGERAGRIEGMAGTDVIAGGPGVDRLLGGAGFDRILARDGRADRIDCGAQVDRVFTDASDRPPANCERRSPSFAPALAPVRRTLAGGAVPVRVTCPAQAFRRCVGAVRLVTVRRLRTAAGRRRPATLGAARFNAPPGGSVEVPVRVRPEGRAALDRLGGATRVRAVARGRDEAGPARPAATRFILRR